MTDKQRLAAWVLSCDSAKAVREALAPAVRQAQTVRWDPTGTYCPTIPPMGADGSIVRH